MSFVRQMLGPGIADLFDSVNHDSAREKVEWLLFEPLPDRAAIISRQQLLLSLMKSPYIQRPLMLHKTEVNEIKIYLDTIGRSDSIFERSVFASFFPRNRKAIAHELSRLKQLIIFLRRIRNQYFNPFLPESVDKCFHAELNFMNGFLESLETERNAGLIAEGNFRFKSAQTFYAMLKKKESANEVAMFFGHYALLEAYISVAGNAAKRGFVFPVFITGSTVSFTAFYHPLLKHPVSNDLHFSENVVVLTGPNMSGKSTLLKALVICVLLAHQGLPVPASSGELGCFDAIFSSVNTSDDLSQGYSQFFAEIGILKETLIAAAGGQQCFAVFDELFRGTNAAEGKELLLKTLKGFAKYPKCRVMVSTHIGEIKPGLEAAKAAFQAKHIESRVEAGLPVFTYRLADGWSELKLGQVIFRNSGLDGLLNEEN